MDLEVLITTSYVQSCPSTSLIDKTIESLSSLLGIDNLVIYIICDGYNIIPDGNRRFVKSGMIYEQDARDYDEYISNLYSKYTSTNITIIKQPDHNGYAKNLKYCLDNYIKTKYFMILQHDHIFIKDTININTVINCLEVNNINYIGFPSITNCNEVNNRLVRIEFREFLLEIEGKINDYIKLSDENRRKIINKKEYEIFDKDGNLKFLNDQTPSRDLVTNIILNYTQDIYGLRLMPLVFWYDKTHLCRTDYYRNNIFKNDDIKIISFIEDTFGIHQKNDIIKNGFQSFSKYRSFLYYEDFPDSIMIKHNSGRHYLSDSDRDKRIIFSKNQKKN